MAMQIELLLFCKMQIQFIACCVLFWLVVDLFASFIQFVAAKHCWQIDECRLCCRIAHSFHSATSCFIHFAALEPTNDCNKIDELMKQNKEMPTHVAARSAMRQHNPARRAARIAE